ncbi:MAG: hypothetical protein INR71_06725 [Terriglobus roseus]|nr:hypothetical protein [Terriglobus roseus]
MMGTRIVAVAWQQQQQLVFQGEEKLTLQKGCSSARAEMADEVNASLAECGGPSHQLYELV